MRFYLSLPLIVAISACAPPAREPAPTLGAENAESAIRGGAAVPSVNAVARSTVSLARLGKASCTASLLSGSIAVSAAHCVDHRHKGNLAFVEGFTIDFGGGVSRPVRAWRYHPEWAEGLRRKRLSTLADQNGDVILLRFDGGLPPGFAPAALLPESERLREGDEVLLAGYGATEDKFDAERILRQTTVPVLRARDGFYEIHLDQRAGRGACKGDSGGPAFVVKNGKPLLWGVTSRMIEWEDGVDYLCRRTSVYADLRRLEPWLSRALSELNQE